MLYQLSYASPIHPEKIPETCKNRTGTLPLRTYYGTEIKVSTPRRREQTGRKSKCRLYRWSPRRQLPPEGLETHSTADMEVGATHFRIGIDTVLRRFRWLPIRISAVGEARDASCACCLGSMLSRLSPF